MGINRSTHGVGSFKPLGGVLYFLGRTFFTFFPGVSMVPLRVRAVIISRCVWQLQSAAWYFKVGATGGKIFNIIVGAAICSGYGGAAIKRKT